MRKRIISAVGAGNQGSEKSIGRLLSTWLPPIVWSAAIFYFSTLPGSSFRLPEIEFFDKSIHMVVFGILNLLVLRVSRGMRNERMVLYGGTIYSILYGLSDEIHQFYVPGRVADPYDFLADVAGIMIGYVIFTRFFWGPREGADDGAL